jgi:hypothetical protein
VTAALKVRATDAPEADAHVVDVGDGYKVILISKCDSFVSITAISDTVGIVRRLGDAVPDWLSCREPEIKFDDFVIVALTFSTTNPEFKTADFWSSTLGDAAMKANPKLPEEIAGAFAEREYGKVSVITTELEKSVRDVGKVDEANFFYALALDAAARGVLTMVPNDKGDPAKADVLDYSAESKRFELKPDMIPLVGEYQMKNLGYLGYTSQSSKLGKLDLETKMSLPGGKDVRLSDFQIGKDAAVYLNGDQLYNLPMQRF